MLLGRFPVFPMTMENIMEHKPVYRNIIDGHTGPKIILNIKSTCIRCKQIGPMAI